MLFRRDSTTNKPVDISMTGIDAIITNHLEMMFRDVADQAADKVHSGDGFDDQFIILMAVVMEGNSIIGLVICVDSGSSNDRAAKVSADVFQDLF